MIADRWFRGWRQDFSHLFAFLVGLGLHTVKVDQLYEFYPEPGEVVIYVEVNKVDLPLVTGDSIVMFKKDCRLQGTATVLSVTNGLWLAVGAEFRDFIQAMTKWEKVSAYYEIRVAEASYRTSLCQW